VTSFEHVRQQRPCQRNRAGQICRQHVGIARIAGADKAPAATADAGVVYQHVHLAEVLERQTRQAANIVGQAHVGWYRQRRAAAARQLAGQRLERLSGACS
jgi:hypothetical protein